MTLSNKSLIIGIDASRNRSGGARNHLIGIIKKANPKNFGVKKVHVWSYSSLLDSLPNYKWLFKHSHSFLEKSIFHQMLWQIFFLPYEFKRLKCHIILNTDAGSLSTISPSVTMSRDMLSYEPGEMERHGFSLSRLRLLALKYVQNRSFRNANAVIFLTKYASKIIKKSCGNIKKFALIPHGISLDFRIKKLQLKTSNLNNKTIKLLYVSNYDLYKHQWHVVNACEILRSKGYNISITLVGGGVGKARLKLENQISKSDPKLNFVKVEEFASQTKVIEYLSVSDIFVFASSCENMPNTLLEGMASGLPIACSNRGPMPEILQKGGVYFDPENPISIANSISFLIDNPLVRKKLSSISINISKQYSWERCSKETFKFLKSVYLDSRV